MAFKQRRCLFKVGQHPRGVGGMFPWLAGEGASLGRFQRQAPMQINAAEARCLFEKRQPVVHEYLRDRVGVMFFPG